MDWCWKKLGVIYNNNHNNTAELTDSIEALEQRTDDVVVDTEIFI